MNLEGTDALENFRIARPKLRPESFRESYRYSGELGDTFVDDTRYHDRPIRESQRFIKAEPFQEDDDEYDQDERHRQSFSRPASKLNHRAANQPNSSNSNHELPHQRMYDQESMVSVLSRHPSHINNHQPTVGENRSGASQKRLSLYDRQSNADQVSYMSSASHALRFMPNGTTPITFQPRGRSNSDLEFLSKPLPYNKSASVCFNILRVLSAIFIIWDSISDWMVVVKWDDYECGGNPYENYKYFKYDICDASRETVRQVFVVFTIIGTVFGVIQIVNIFLTILYERDKVRFKLLEPRTEVYISIFLEEIPQTLLLLLFSFNCSCEKILKIFVLISMMSSFVTPCFRYMTSYTAVGSDIGCCNVWWRCCFCKNPEMLCDFTTRSCCSTCTFPCPLCCCNVVCDDCRVTVTTWSSALSCTWCNEDTDLYGLRLVKNAGILVLFSCILAAIIFFSLSGWD